MPKHDPVSAITENEATGEIAAIFADIRNTMYVPMLTSIWRILAGVENSLPATWKATKPLFTSGQPNAVYHKLQTRISLPVPSPLTTAQLATVGISRSDISTISAILNAYNRSNGMNFLALTALFEKSADIKADEALIPEPALPASLPPLLTQSDMNKETWDLLHDLNQFGASLDEPGLATLWRHLAHWPGLLNVIHDGLAPLQNNGSIARSIQQLLVFAKSEGPRLAHYRTEKIDIPDTARRMITKYVSHPGLVVRMVAIGLELAQWLEAYKFNRNPKA